MYNGKFDTRLYDLFVRFRQGDKDCYESIIKRFAGLINKSSYNSYIGALDDDLRAEIYVALFLRLQRFTIPDNLNSADGRRNAQAGLPNVPK